MKAFLQELIEYSHSCNEELIGEFSDELLAERISEKAFLWMSHILNATSVWNSRILNKKDRVGIWEVYDSQKMKQLEDENFRESLKILEKTDLESIISYVNSKGSAYKNTVKDILFHTVNHATYHRGQIAREFRNCSLQPLISDYIFYKR